MVRLSIFDDAGGVARAAAEEVAALASSEARLSWALTGGSAARLVLPLLIRMAIPWKRLHLYWTDERCVAPDHPDSNYGLCEELLLRHVDIPPSHVHRMLGESQDTGAAAEAYRDGLRLSLGDPPAIDLVHLGMGADGHVASLFPAHALLDATEHVAAIADAPKPPARRLTLTMPVLCAARRMRLIVTGAEKANAVRAVVNDPESGLPAALVARAVADAVLYLDRAAARHVT